MIALRCVNKRMVIKVSVIPNAKKTTITNTAPGHYRVRVTAAPVKGRANQELIRLLAEHFGTAPSSITIKRGVHSRNKIIEISE